MADIIEGNFITKLDIPVERVLRQAQEANLASVVVLGYDADGEEYFKSSISDGGTVVWLMRRAEKHLLEIGD